MPESVDEAKALLATGRDRPAARSHIEVAFLQRLVHTRRSAEYLQAAWQDNLGIKIKLSPIEDSAYSDWRAPRETQKFSIYTGSWGSDFADASNWFNQNFTSSADHYRNHWSNAEFDQLCATAVTNTNTEERNHAVRAGRSDPGRTRRRSSRSCAARRSARSSRG